MDKTMNRKWIERRERRENGFSMIEILISTVIFSMGVLSLGQVFVLGVSSVNQTKYQIRATNLAQQLMEEIQAKTFDEIMVGQDPSKERDTTAFRQYKTPGATLSGFLLDSGESNGISSTFDDMDDFANYTEDPMISDTKFKASVKVVYAQDTNLNGSA